MWAKVQSYVAAGLLTVGGCAGCGGALASEGKGVLKEAVREAVWITSCEEYVMSDGTPLELATPACEKAYERWLERRKNPQPIPVPRNPNTGTAL